MFLHKWQNTLDSLDKQNSTTQGFQGWTQPCFSSHLRWTVKAQKFSPQTSSGPKPPREPTSTHPAPSPEIKQVPFSWLEPLFHLKCQSFDIFQTKKKIRVCLMRFLIGAYWHLEFMSRKIPYWCLVLRREFFRLNDPLHHIRNVIIPATPSKPSILNTVRWHNHSGDHKSPHPGCLQELVPLNPLPLKKVCVCVCVYVYIYICIYIIYCVFIYIYIYICALYFTDHVKTFQNKKMDT